MPKPPSVIPTHELFITMPEPLYQRMEALLRSDLTGTIPYGARRDLIVSLLTNYLNIVEGVIE